uniref:RING-type E3 ubiquitin transferase n=1 Tax=Trichuris muris TaxID=70415 RepID=A0A5S6QYJ1_TRIMR
MIFSWLIVLQLLLSNCAATTFIIYMFRSNGTFVKIYDDCTAVSAEFGKKIIEDEQTLCAVPVVPANACTSVRPLFANTSAYCINGIYALAERGNCSFALKAHNVQEADYAGVLVINDQEELLTMAGDGQYDRDVNIPALMVPRKCGFKLVIEYPFTNGYGLMLRLWWSYGNALRFLIPFVAVITLSFFILLAVVGVRWHRSQTRLRRRRLSKRQLRGLPVRTFSKGSTTETCAICLEDFAEGDRIRILTCNHSYHCGCVDPWLLKRRKVCPICKRNVLGGIADDTDSDSLDEQATPNESSPLLSSGGEDSSTDNVRVQVGNSVFYADYGSTRCCSLTSPSDELYPPGSSCGVWRRDILTEKETSSVDPTVAMVNDFGSCSKDDVSPPQVDQPSCSATLQGGIANPSFVREDNLDASRTLPGINTSRSSAESE